MKKQLLTNYNLEDIVEIISEYIENNVKTENKLLKEAIFLINQKGYFEIEDFGKIEGIIDKCNTKIESASVNYIEIKIFEESTQRFQEREVGIIEVEHVLEINRKYLQREIRLKIYEYSKKLVEQICNKKFDIRKGNLNRKNVTKKLAKLPWVVNTINYDKFKQIHDLTSKYLHEFMKKYKEEYIMYLEKKPRITSFHTKKIKWIGEMSQLVFIFQMLIDLGYIEITKKDEDLDYDSYIDTLFNCFEFKEGTFDTLQDYVKNKANRPNNNFLNTVFKILNEKSNTTDQFSKRYLIESRIVLLPPQEKLRKNNRKP